MHAKSMTLRWFQHVLHWQFKHIRKSNSGHLLTRRTITNLTASNGIGEQYATLIFRLERPSSTVLSTAYCTIKQSRSFEMISIAKIRHTFTRSWHMTFCAESHVSRNWIKCTILLQSITALSPSEFFHETVIFFTLLMNILTSSIISNFDGSLFKSGMKLHWMLWVVNFWPNHLLIFKHFQAITRGFMCKILPAHPLSGYVAIPFHLFCLFCSLILVSSIFSVRRCNCSELISFCKHIFSQHGLRSCICAP